MIYGYRCWRCDELIPEDKLEYDQDNRRKCLKCGAISTRSHQIISEYSLIIKDRLRRCSFAIQ